MEAHNLLKATLMKKTPNLILNDMYPADSLKKLDSKFFSLFLIRSGLASSKTDLQMMSLP